MTVRAIAAAALGGALTLAILPRAATAGADSPSLRPDMPPEVHSLREETLSVDEYRVLLGRWRAYSARHPKEAVAYVMTSRAMRYAREGTPEARHELLLKAYDVDPDCPEALEALSCASLGEPGTLNHAEARRYGLRAIEAAPDWARPHLQLWGVDMAERDTESAAEHARAMIDKRGIGAPLLDFAHNLLASADRDAIIFTNGDNDTYPPAALQAKFGTRPDVRIVNLSLLNILGYALEQLGGGAPFPDREIRALHEGWKDEYRESQRIFSQQLLALVAARVRSGEWESPVYLAVTVAGSHMSVVEQKLRVEGLLWRILPEVGGSDDDEDPEIEYAKTLRVFRDDFRLDSATDRAFPWERRSSVAHLMTNYPAVLRLVATEAAERGDRDAVRFAMERALGIFTFHGKDDMVERLSEYWDGIDPDRPKGGT